MKSTTKAKTLLWTDMPKNGESLAGYLLRLTELNHYDTTSWIMELAKFNSRMHKSFAFVFNSSLDLGLSSNNSNLEQRRILISKVNDLLLEKGVLFEKDDPWPAQVKLLLSEALN